MNNNVDHAVARVLDDQTAYKGTAFFITHRHLLTCKHVLYENADLLPDNRIYVQASLKDAGIITAKIEKVIFHPTRDVVLLVLPEAGSLFDGTPISFDEITQLKIGDNVIVKGYSHQTRGMESPTLTISSYAGEQITYTAHTSVASGLSGAAVLLEGKLAGIMQARDTEKNQCNIIPLLEFNEWLKKNIHNHTNNKENESDSLSDIFNEIEGVFKPLFSDKLNHFSSFNNIGEEFQFLSFILKHQKEDFNCENIKLIDFLSSLNHLTAQTIIQIRGNPGTGKSTLLSVTNTYLRQLVQQDSSACIPVFIDTNAYLSEQLLTTQKRLRKIDRNLKTIAEKCERYNNKVLLMIDGVSMLTPISSHISKNVATYFGSQNIVGILVGIEDNFDFAEFVNNNREFFNFNDDYINKVFYLETFDTGRSDTDNFLRSFIDCHSTLRGEVIQDSQCVVDYLKEKINVFELEKLDAHTLQLLYGSYGNKEYDRCETISEFLRRYCEKELTTRGYLVKEDFLDLSKLAYQILISSISGKNGSNTDEKLSNLLELVNSHINIRDFLASNYIVNKIVKKEILDNKILEYDFPNTVNRFVKNIINENRIINTIFKSISTLLKTDNLPVLSENYLFYLLGRFETVNVRKQAINLLITYKNKYIKSSFDDQRILNKARLRTIFVSLAYLEDDTKSVDEYISILLQDHESASINRGYHLIYYGDKKLGKNDINAERYLDDKQYSWNKTFDSLTSDIRKHIQACEDEQPYQIRILDIRVISLASFAQSRMITGGLTDLQRQQITELLEKLISGDCCLINNNKLVAYCRSILIDLARPNFTNWTFILDIYQIKLTARQGWLDRNVGIFDIKNRVESVAEHTYLAYLLAEFLLPNTDQLSQTIYADASYLKEKVISIILTHDIAESYLGDHVIVNLTPKNKEVYCKKEKQTMEYISIRETYNDYPLIHNSLEVFNSWLEFDGANKNGDDINAKIAKDIDRLENFIQLWIYQNRISETKFSEFRDKLLVSFKTPLIRDLANSFDEWCKNDQHTSWKLLPIFQPNFSDPQ